MKKAWQNFLKSFQPTYSVTVSMYHVIPGTQIQKYDHKHDFDKGEIEKARVFYNSVVKMHAATNFPNTEIKLIKGKKTVLHMRQFGPVEMVKSLNVA